MAVLAVLLAAACSGGAQIQGNIEGARRASDALTAEFGVPVGLTVDMFAETGVLNCVVTLRGTDAAQYSVDDLRQKVSQILERETGSQVSQMKLVIEYP